MSSSRHPGSPTTGPRNSNNNNNNNNNNNETSLTLHRHYHHSSNKSSNHFDSQCTFNPSFSGTDISLSQI
jgi:hypothetical protein